VSGYVLTTYNDADDDDELLIETHWLWLMSSQWVSTVNADMFTYTKLHVRDVIHDVIPLFMFW